MSTRYNIKRLGSDAAIYQPGPESADFLHKVFARNQSALPFAFKLALLLNDAIHQIGIALDFEGIFFATFPGMHASSYPPTRLWAAGPQLFFAPYTLSEDNRKEWGEASFVRKLELSSATWKHQFIKANSPVLPIWVPNLVPTSYSQTLLQDKRGTPFASDARVQAQGADPAELELPGVVVDLILRSHFFLARPKEFKERARLTSVGPGGPLGILLVKRGKITTSGQWYMDQLVRVPKDGCPTRRLLVSIRNQYRSKTDMPELSTYQRLHQWRYEAPLGDGRPWMRRKTQFESGSDDSNNEDDEKGDDDEGDDGGKNGRGGKKKKGGSKSKSTKSKQRGIRSRGDGDQGDASGTTARGRGIVRGHGTARGRGAVRGRGAARGPGRKQGSGTARSTRGGGKGRQGKGAGAATRSRGRGAARGGKGKQGKGTGVTTRTGDMDQWSGDEDSISDEGRVTDENGTSVEEGNSGSEYRG